MNTAVLTRTLTVNAAFLAEIKEDNYRLRELLSEGAEDAANGNLRRISARERAELYIAIRDQLGLHFALEDAYGYFHDAIEDKPWLTKNAKALQGQHDIIFR
ncbi:MAG: hemerythrin domain-containing protein, partial [Planctomycetota bacterium]|nr:hemerythrin domain-containing protein [Planctomycetota bacterium]